MATITPFARLSADHVEQVHHAYLWGELSRLGELVQKVYSVHGERHPELVTDLGGEGRVGAAAEDDDLSHVPNPRPEVR